MFSQKKSTIFARKEQIATPITPGNPFIQAARAEQNVVATQNGAKAYSKLEGDVLTTQFGSIGTQAKYRDYRLIAKDMQDLWAENADNAVKFAFYVRMISRTVQYLDGTKTAEPQRGMELKNEGIMRLIWLAVNQPDTFYKNIELVPIVGSWKDIIQMLSFDLQYHGWNNRVLNWDVFGKFILLQLENPNTSELIKKYLPSIKSNKRCTTIEAEADNIIAKWICALLFGAKEGSEGANYKKYRLLKTSGTAHEWQKLISKKYMDKLEFDKIPGRALKGLVRSKFLVNQKLQEKYETWVASMVKAGTAIKYTGFVHELFVGAPTVRSRTNHWPQHQQDTLNLQFKGLVDKNKGSEDRTSSLIVVRDTSMSMSRPGTGTTMSCYDVAKALALYFSEFLTGHFANSWIEFNSSAKFHTWNGNTPYEKWYNDSSSFVGSTNFQSVIQLLTTIKRSGVEEVHFPTGILCISDSEFNPAQLSHTNFEAARQTLRAAGFSDAYVSKFTIVLWNLQDSGNAKFHTGTSTVPGTYYFSGYSAATIALLDGDIKSAGQLALAALDQEVLSLIEM